MMMEILNNNNIIHIIINIIIIEYKIIGRYLAVGRIDHHSLHHHLLY